MFRHAKPLLGLAVFAAVLSGSAAAHAGSAEVEVFANPDTVGVGVATPVSATGLGGLETAGFGLDNTTGGSLSSDASTYGPTAEARVNDGNALVYFKASQAGTYTVDVTDGETPLGQTTITVTADAPTTGPQLSASPASIESGRSATITATGLGGLETAGFGLGGGPSGAQVNPSDARVSDGTASTTFTATQPGTYTVDVTDGETPLATVEITVTAASPTPTPTQTSTPTTSPTPAPTPSDSGVPAAVVWIIVIVAVLVVAAVVITAVVLARRRGAGGTPTA